MGTATRKEFEGDAACTRKEIERTGSLLLEVDVGPEDIKEILLGEICGGTSLERTGDIEMTTAIFTCYNSHDIPKYILYPIEEQGHKIYGHLFFACQRNYWEDIGGLENFQM
jgi:hypothetical protein